MLGTDRESRGDSRNPTGNKTTRTSAETEEYWSGDKKGGDRGVKKTAQTKPTTPTIPSIQPFRPFPVTSVVGLGTLYTRGNRPTVVGYTEIGTREVCCIVVTGLLL